MVKISSSVQFLLIFIGSFFIGFYFLNYSATSNKSSINPTNDPLRDYTKMPSNIVELNGKKVRVFTGVSNMSAQDFISKMKVDMAGNNEFKLIHENNTDNRFYLTYSENGIMISAVVNSQADGTCNYQIYKAEESLSGNAPSNQNKFPAMPDAISVLTLQGSGNQSVFSYTTKYTQEEIFSFYRKELVKTGYREEEINLPEKLEIKEIESKEILFIKDRKNLMISVSTDPAGNGNMVYMVGS